MLEHCHKSFFNGYRPVKVAEYHPFLIVRGGRFLLVIGHCQSHLSRTGKVYTIDRTLSSNRARRPKTNSGTLFVNNLLQDVMQILPENHPGNLPKNHPGNLPKNLPENLRGMILPPAFGFLSFGG